MKLSIPKQELDEQRGLGAFGKGRSRRWYKRRLNRAERHVVHAALRWLCA